MKKSISVSLSVIFALALIFSAPSSLMFLYTAKAQVGSSIFQGAATRSPNVLPLQNSPRLVLPVANAGQNKMVQPGATVLLNGSASFDPNRGGFIVNYRWTQVSGIPVTLQGGNQGGNGVSIGIGSPAVPSSSSGLRSSSSSINSNTPFASFTVPIVPLNTATPLAFSLTVTDNLGLTSNPSIVSVLIIPQQQQQLQSQQRQLQQQPSITPQQSLPQQSLPQQPIGPTRGTLNLPPHISSQFSGPFRSPNKGILTSPPNAPYQYPNPNRSHIPLYLYQLNPGLSNSNRPLGIIPNSNPVINSKGLTANILVRSPTNGTTSNITTASPSLSGAKQQPVINATSNSRSITGVKIPTINNAINPKTSANSIINPTISASVFNNTKSNTNGNNLPNSIHQPPKKGTSSSTKTSTTNIKNQTNASLNVSKTNTNATTQTNTKSNIKPRVFGSIASPQSPSSCSNTGSASAPIPVGSFPQGAVFNPTNCDIYVANNNDNTVSVIDGSTNTVVGSPISVGAGPQGLAYDAAKNYIYVTNEGDNTVSVIDGSTNTVVGSPIPVGNNPTAAAVDTANGDIYVTNGEFVGGQGSVSVLDGSTNTVVDTIPVGVIPEDIVYDASNNYIYVVLQGTGQTNSPPTLKIIDGSTNTVLPVGSLPNQIHFGATLDTANGNIYVTNSGANFPSGTNAVSVIQGQGVVGSPIPVGREPTGIAYDPIDNHIYVANEQDGTVSVIDASTNTVVGDPIPVGSHPTRIAVDTANGNVYVSNPVEGTVSVIPVSAPLSVTSTNPADGATGVTTSSSISATFTESLKSSTVNSFTLCNTELEGCPQVTGTISLSSDGKTATLQPTNPLSATTTYQASISTDAQDTNGNNMTSPFSWTFTTAAAVPLSVTSTNPADGVTVPVPSSISAAFNEAVKPNSIISPATTFSLTCGGACGGGDVRTIPGSVSLSSDGTTATFTPNTPLQPSTGYTATISTGVQDASGNNLASPKTWSFTTAAATATPTITISSVNPSSPKWGIDPVVVSGTSTNAAGSTITIDWGDGTANTTGITINEDGSWSTSSTQVHKYAPTAAGTQPTIFAQLITNCDELSTCAGPFDSSQLTAVKAHTTTLTLNPMTAGVTAGTPVTAIGQLVDADLPGSSQLIGKPITFTGTGSVFTTIEPNNAAPVATTGVNFTDPSGSVNIHSCANCVLDSGPGGSLGANKVMHLHAGSTISFSPGITEVTLSMQDMGTTSFTYSYTTSDNVQHTGNTGVGPASSLGYIPDIHIQGGKLSDKITPSNIKQITVNTVTDSSTTSPDNPVPGTIGISKMVLQNLQGESKELQTVDFENLAVGSNTYTATTANPFVANAGFFFSVGISQTQVTPPNTSLQVTAHFAGDSAYSASDSTPQSYTTTAPTSALGAAGEASTTAFNGNVYTTATCTADTDADGICDNWETPGKVTGCPTNNDCIPITNSAGTVVGAYDLCYTDAFYNVWQSTAPASGTVCPSVNHKDVFVQLSWMQGHNPDPAAVKLVIKAFGNSPVVDGAAPVPLTGTAPNQVIGAPPGYPAPLKGVVLHVVLDNGEANNLGTRLKYATPNQSTFNVWTDSDTNINNDFNSVKQNNFGTFAERHLKNAAGQLTWTTGCATGTPPVNTIECPRDAKAQVYHYGLFIRTFGGPSGVSELPGNDFIVSLGQGFGTSNSIQPSGDGFGGTVGTTDEQAGTFMHELGHNFDLDHGGPHIFRTSTGAATTPLPTDYTVNCKPNYLSVMNYARQLPTASFVGTVVGTQIPWEGQGLDYSRLTPNTVVNALVEGGLSKTTGIGTYPTANTVLWGIPSGTTSKIYGQGISSAIGFAINWNQISTTPSPLTDDANNLGIQGCQLPTASALQTYKAYDDWDNLLYNFRAAGTNWGADGAFSTYPPIGDTAEMTGPMYQTLKTEAFAAQGFTLIPPVVNTGKCSGCNAGSTVPVKFQLQDISGKFITNAKVTFTAQQINPTTGASIGSPVVGPNPSFSYITNTNTYQYNWKTPSVKGTYVLKLYIDYNLPTQKLLVGQGLTDSTTTLQLS